jgi:catechol 2,3-dioxygenase-like lactoylglutathione lyase family enzyme
VTTTEGNFRGLAAQATRDVLIQTPDAAGARAFYGGVLGLTTFDDNPEMTGFDAGPLRISVQPAPALAPILEFVVDDHATAIDQLMTAGCNHAQPDGIGHHRYIRDPFGLVFYIAGPEAEAEPGV